MPRKLAGGHKLRSIFETEKTSTDPVLTNKHDDFQMMCNWPVRQKAKPVKRISLKQTTSASEQLKETSVLRHVKSSNDEHKTHEKPADMEKYFAEYTFIDVSPYMVTLENNSEKCVNKSSDKKNLRNVVEQLKNECLNLLGAEWLIVVLKQVITDAKRSLVMEKVQNDNNDENGFIKKATAVASNSEEKKEVQNTSSDVESDAKDNLPKCSDQNMQMQNYIDKLNNLKVGREGREEKYSIVFKEFADLCGQISGSMLHIENKFKKLKRPFCCNHVDFSQWCEILWREVESMSSLILLFEEKAKHHQGLEFFLQFLKSSKMTVAEVIEQKLEKTVAMNPNFIKMSKLQCKTYIILEPCVGSHIIS